MLAFALPEEVGGIVRGIVRVVFRQQYRPPIQSQFLEFTFELALCPAGRRNVHAFFRRSR